MGYKRGIAKHFESMWSIWSILKILIGVSVFLKYSITWHYIIFFLIFFFLDSNFSFLVKKINFKIFFKIIINLIKVEFFNFLNTCKKKLKNDVENVPCTQEINYNIYITKMKFSKFWS